MTARLLIYFTRPGTADSDKDELAALENHIARCSECEALANAERGVEKRIADAMKNVPVPSELRARIVEHMAIQRRLRWRAVLKHHPKIAVAAAAAILVVSFVGLYTALRPLPVLDLGQRLNAGLDQRSAQPQQIEKWFRETHGVQAVAPPNFNYAFLDFYDLVVDATGKRVPQLVFVHGNDRARVLIVTSKDFDLRAALLEPPADSGGLKVEVCPHPWRTDVEYLVLHNSSSLDWLVTQEQPAS